MKLQKLGGCAAIAGVCCLIIFVIMRGPTPDLMDAVKKMAAFSAPAPAHPVVRFLLYSVGFLLAFVMFLALHERMQAGAVHLTRTMIVAASAGTAVAITRSILMCCGMIVVPAQDVSALRALSAVDFSLALMGHHTYGWARLLMGCAILKTCSFSRILGWLNLFAGIVWIPTSIVPQLARVSLLIIIALLLSAVATVWVGIALLRQKQPQPVAKEIAAAN